MLQLEREYFARPSSQNKACCVGGLTLQTAQRVAEACLDAGREHGFDPLAVVVLDTGGHDLVGLRHEAAGFYRTEIARAKAASSLGMAMDGVTLAERAKAAPGFYAGLAGILSRGMVPAPGGVLLRDKDGVVIGAVGISGDMGSNDEIAARDGIAAALGAAARQPLTID